MNVEHVDVRAMQPDDVEPVRALAHAIWHAHYPAIISIEQIEYMLEQRYAPEVLRDELQRTDLWWELATAGAEPVGFSSCLLTGKAGEIKLDKLYVLPQRHGQGVGRALLASVCSRARRLNCGRLILAVNKRNAGPIAAYRRWGFVIEQAVVQEIGEGFVMDDYLMVLAL
jgi:diamine N-acetyltransferase